LGEEGLKFVSVFVAETVPLAPVSFVFTFALFWLKINIVKS